MSKFTPSVVKRIVDTLYGNRHAIMSLGVNDALEQLCVSTDILKFIDKDRLESILVSMKDRVNAFNGFGINERNTIRMCVMSEIAKEESMESLLKGLLGELGDLLDETIKESKEVDEPIQLIEELEKFEVYVKQELIAGRKPKIPGSGELLNEVAKLGYQPHHFLAKFIEAIQTAGIPHLSMVNKFLKENTFEDIRLENRFSQSLKDYFNNISATASDETPARNVKECTCYGCKNKQLIEGIIEELNIKGDVLDEAFHYNIPLISGPIEICIGRKYDETYIYKNGVLAASFKTPDLQNYDFEDFVKTIMLKVKDNL